MFLWWTWKQKKTDLKNGFLTGWFLIILFSLRFIDEFFKINQEQFENDLILNMGQILSIPFVMMGIVILLWIRNRRAGSSLENSINRQTSPERL
jgi:prolipoprotein diacylglyceryltransferase